MEYAAIDYQIGCNANVRVGLVLERPYDFLVAARLLDIAKCFLLY